MRKRVHIFHQTVLLLTMTAVLLTACSSDDSGAQGVAAGPLHVVHLMPYTTSYVEPTSGHRAAPAGYGDYPVEAGTEMGVYVLLPEDYEAPKVPAEQLIRYDGSKWHAYFSVEKIKDYVVYGYLPKATGMNSTLTKSTADAATLTITGKGSYTGAITKSFKINPKGTSLAKLVKAKKAVTVKWKKQKTKMSKARITGYQIQLATDKKFTKNKKTVTVKGYKKVSKKVTKLKGGKKYYVKIRTYKTIKGKKYYSKWSKVKTIKTKK